MPHIFISYSRKDLAIAKPIVNALIKDDLDIWIDWEDIPKGEEFYQEIYRGIEQSDAFLFLVSPDSVTSGWCNKEIDHAIQNGKRILPIVLRDTDPKLIHQEITKRNWIFCREGQDDFDKAIEEALITIHTDFEWLNYHTRLQVKALEWERKKDNSRLLRGKELQEAEQKLATAGSQKDPQPTPVQRQYVLASRKDEELRRRRTVTALTVGFIVLAFLCVIAAIASIIALQQRNIALTREQEALAAQARAEEERRIALSKGLATQSRLLFDEQLDLALLLSVLSGQIDASPDAVGSLHDALEHRPDMVQYLNGAPTGGVVQTAYTQDGSQLVAIGIDGSILRWDINSGKPVGDSIQSPGLATLGLTLGPGGETWIIILDESGVFVWEAVSGQQVGAKIIFSADVDGDGKPNLPGIAALSPDGKTLATAVYEEISVWDLQSGQLLGKSDVFLGYPPSALGFSPDSSILASAGNEWQIYLWDSLNGLSVGIWPTSQTRNITSLTFSADGRYIASGSVDGTVNLFDRSTGEQILRQPSYSITTGQEIPPPALGHPAEVRSVALSPDGELLVSGAVDGNMLIWETNTMTPFAAPAPAYVGPILTLAWSPDGESFATGGGDDSITIWQPNKTWRLSRNKGDDDLNLNFAHEATQSEEAGQQNTLRVTHIKSGYWAISGCVEVVESYEPCPSGFVEAYNADGQKINLQPAEISSWPSGLTFNPDGTKLAVVSCETVTGYDCSGSVIWIWDFSSGEVKRHDSSFVRFARLLFSPDNRYVVVGGEGKDVMLFDLLNEKETRLSLLNLPGQITGLAFSPDGTRLAASASYEDPGPYANTIQHGRLMVWDTESGQVIAYGNVFGSTAGELAFNEDGQLLEYFTSEGSDYPFHIWTLGMDRWQELACRIANRNLTESEWQRYVIGEDYRPVCP